VELSGGARDTELLRAVPPNRYPVITTRPSLSARLENVLTSVAEANIGSIFGIGFPAWTGGAMQFIYGMGVEAFEQRAAELAQRFGPGFALSDEVRATIRRYQPVY
jgi:hypothetical protein